MSTTEPKIDFICDSCGKQQKGGDMFLDLPEGWAYTYHTFARGRDKKDYCSMGCFEKQIDILLAELKVSEIDDFARNMEYNKTL